MLRNKNSVNIKNESLEKRNQVDLDLQNTFIGEE